MSIKYNNNCVFKNKYIQKELDLEIIIFICIDLSQKDRGATKL